METKDVKDKTADASLLASSNAEQSSSKAVTEKNVKGSEEGKNRGWPKGKKRYPKSPGAPKQPLSGYVHFLNDRRETVRKENPDMSFADISKKLAVEWGQVDAKKKQDYADRAEADKGRYNKAFAEYQLTDEYKQFIESQKKKESEATAAGSVSTTKRPAKDQNSSSAKKKKTAMPSSAKEKSKDNSKYASHYSKTSPSDKNAIVSTQPSRMTDSANSVVGKKISVADSETQNNTFKVRKDMPFMYTGSTTATTDIPIFREEFLEHNKAREAELKQLRRQANEFEEQNAILQKHVENMRSAIGKLEQETTQQQENNVSLAKHLDAMRRLVVTNFQGIVLPSADESSSPINPPTNNKHVEFKLTMENVDDFIARLRTIVYEKSKESDPLLVKVKEIAEKLDYSSLPFEA